MQATPLFNMERTHLNSQSRQRKLKEKESKSNLVFWNFAWLLINGVIHRTSCSYFWPFSCRSSMMLHFIFLFLFLLLFLLFRFIMMLSLLFLQVILICCTVTANLSPKSAIPTFFPFDDNHLTDIFPNQVSRQDIHFKKQNVHAPAC